MTLLEPFQFAFFRNGLIVATLAGALCGMMGAYVTVRGMSYIGHGLSHSIFGGAAASAVLSVNFYLGAGLWGVASALMIGRLGHRRVIGSDAAIGVVTTASFALGIALLNRFGQVRKSLDAALFGSVLGVSSADVWVVLTVTLFAATLVFLGYRLLLFTTFDPDVASAVGVNVRRVDAMLMIVLAVSILGTMQVLGVMLIAAALVIPPVTARMISHRFSRMLTLSTTIGAACGLVGMNLSYHLDIASGPSIALVGACLLGVAMLIAPQRRSVLNVH